MINVEYPVISVNRFLYIKDIMTKRKIFISVVVIALFLTSLSRFYTGIRDAAITPDEFFSSDTMYIPALYRDLVKDGYLLSGWKLPPAPCFFPDMPVYFFSAYFTSDVESSMALYGVIYISVFLIVLTLLFSELSIKKNIAEGFLTAAASSVFVLTLFISDVNAGALRQIVIPSIHGGAVMTSLFLLWIMIRWMERGGTILEIAIYAVSFAGFISDRMLIPTYMVPASGMLLFDAVVKRKLRSVRMLLLSLAVYGISLYFMQYVTDRKYFNAADINLDVSEYAGAVLFRWESVIQFIKNINPSDDFGRIFILFYAIFFVSLIVISIFIFSRSSSIIRMKSIVTKYIRNGKVNSFDGYALNSIKRLLLFMLILYIVYPPLAVVTIVRMNIAENVARYFNILFFVPLFGVPLLLEMLKKGAGIIFSGILFTSVVIFEIYFFPPSPHDKAIPAKNVAMCMDVLSDKYNFSHGLSDYWNAKSITMFSKRIRIFQAAEDLSMFYWVNNIDWYIQEAGNYQFIITDRLKKPAIVYLFGNPDFVEYCGKSEIYIYSGNMNLRNYWSADSVRLWRKLTAN